MSLFVLYALAGFVATPLLVRHLLKTQVSRSLHRGVRAEAVRANPFSYTIRIRGLSVSDRDGGPFFGAAQLTVNVDPLVSLLKWGLVVHSVVISHPVVRIVRTGPAQLNFTDLLTAPEGSAPQAPPSKHGPIRFVLGKFTLTAGEIHFIDKTRETAFETVFSPLDVQLTGLDTRPGAEAFHYRLSGRTEAREDIEIEGLGRLAPFEMKAAASLKDLVPAKYAAYYQPFFRAGVSDGRVSLGGRVHWSVKERSLSELTLSVSRLDLKDVSDGQILARLPQFDLEGGEMDFITHRIGLGHISASGALLHLLRDSHGKLNLMAAFMPPPQAASAPEPPPEPAAPADAPLWQVTLPVLAIGEATIEFEDRQAVPAVKARLHHLSLAAENISTLAQSRGRVALRGQWADQGTFVAQGELGIDPLAAQLDLEARDLDIRPLQPYLRPYVHLVVTKGDFDTKGQLQLAPGAQGSGIRFSGEASLDGFEAVDEQKAGLFSKWESLRLTGIDVSTAPLRIAIDKISLTDFFDRLAILADGTTNLDAIFGQESRSGDGAEKHPPAPASGSAPAVAPKARNEGNETPIHIKRVALEGGKIDYTDLSIKPNVQLALTGLSGHVQGLDSMREKRADVLLRGMVGGNVPMEIKGRLNPFLSPPYLHMTIDFPGMDLSPFTPYSGKYLGYKLEKGQLAFALSYKVAHNRLEGQNRIHFNQLSFGDVISSPQATKLPIKLAVALLKDRQGNIDLNLPVTGDLDDPQFSLGGIILKMFTHLITNIISSPFKMLGAVFGGGPELAYLDFGAGESRITPPSREKLDILAKILFERPGLKLEIKGQVDPEKDSDGLRRLMFEENLRAAKLKAMVAKGKKALPLERIEIGPQERDDMIRQAYEAAKFPKAVDQKDAKGQQKALSSPEMENRLLKAIDVGAGDLRLLAHRRALAVKAYLLATGKVEGSRLFVIEPDVERRNNEGEPKPQVLLSLK